MEDFASLYAKLEADAREFYRLHNHLRNEIHRIDHLPRGQAQPHSETEHPNLHRLVTTMLREGSL